MDEQPTIADIDDALTYATSTDCAHLVNIHRPPPRPTVRSHNMSEQPEVTWHHDDELDIEIATFRVGDQQVQAGFTTEALQAIGKDILLNWMSHREP
jgi:hypothetical protein